MTVYTYIRVSSVDQNEARQIKTMKENGIQKERMYIDKVSGKNTDRPQYQLLKESCTGRRYNHSFTYGYRMSLNRFEDPL